MCGRYYVDEESNEELLKIVRNLDKRLQSAPDTESTSHVKTGEIFPSDIAPVILNQSGTPCYDAMIWGFENPYNHSLIINARQESAHEKSMFSKSLQETRIVIPASGFFEWSHDQVKQKYFFTIKDSSLLYMAGIKKDSYPFARFVILTTQANASMESIHNRMPVLLHREEVSDYLSSMDYAQKVLKRVPMSLQCTKVVPKKENTSSFEQLSLPF